MLPIRSAKLPPNGMLQAVLRSHTSQWRPTPSTRALSTAPLIRHSIRRNNTTRECKRGQRRWNTSQNKPPQPKGQTFVQQPTFWQIMKRALNIRKMFEGQNLKKMFRESPEETVIAVALLTLTVGCAVVAIYMYFTYFYAEQFTKYPEDVAKSLRRALYYSEHRPDPKLALKYYKLAIEQCQANGLDPFSNEVVGIKIQLAAWLEEHGNIPGAIKVLDLVLIEYKKWLALAVTNPRKLPAAPIPGTSVGEGEEKHTFTEAEMEHWLWQARNRVLGKAVQMSIKLGELYADDHILEKEKSHDHLMWGVEEALKELRRRSTEGVKEDEGPWMSASEIGAALESLGHSYERKLQFDLALPLFFQALRLCQDQCHSAVIMNNLAATFAQHPPCAPYETLAAVIPGEETLSAPAPQTEEKWTREVHLESAQRWAKNALSHAKEPKGEARTPECDQACAVALVTLGDIAALAGDAAHARRRYEQAINMSEKVEYPEGVEQAKMRLQKLA